MKLVEFIEQYLNAPTEIKCQIEAILTESQSQPEPPEKQTDTVRKEK